MIINVAIKVLKIYPTVMINWESVAYLIEMLNNVRNRVMKLPLEMAPMSAQEPLKRILPKLLG